jgi:hypothetical protein
MCTTNFGCYFEPRWQRLSTQKARDFKGKLQNSSLSQHAQWMAVESIVKPAVLYPLVNTFC